MKVRVKVKVKEKARSRRCLVGLFAVAALSWAGAAFAQLGDGESKILPMAYSFSSRAYGGKGFKMDCLSYMRVTSPTKSKPLYIMGWGRRGDMKVVFEDQGLSFYLVKTEGMGRIDYKQYAISAPAADHTQMAASGLLKAKPRIIVNFLSLGQWKQVGERMKPFLKLEKMPDMKKTKPQDIPKPVFNIAADMELSANGKTVKLKAQPGTAKFFIDIGPGRYSPPSFWRMILEIDCKLNGAQLGLTGADAGPLEIKIVGGALAKIPNLKNFLEARKALKKLEEKMGDDDILDDFEGLF